MRSKLAVVVAIPVIAFTAIAGLQIAAAAADGSRLSGFADRAALARPVAAVVTALQNERDRTLGEVAGAVHDDAFDAAVAAERVAVDNAYARLSRVADPVRAAFAAVQARFEQLRDVRAAARTGALPAESIFDAYRDTIIDLFALLPEPAAAPQHGLVGPVIAVLEVARAKEQASQLRARIYAACRARFAEPAMYSTFAEAVAEQRAALVRFRANAAPGVAGALDDASADRTVTALREQILDQVRRRTVTVEPERWWEASTAELTVLATAESRAVDAVVDDSGSLAHAQRSRTLWLTALILIVLVITLGSWVLIGRSMVRSLRDLRKQALDVAQRRLPEAIERLRSVERQADLDNLPTTAFAQLGGDSSRNDEIGEVGEAFAAVHASAVRLAGEQAELRRGANAMIVNVARRSQVLVERQLRLLDAVQTAEDDPDQLANLFRLDHLLTRMRRNDENLLVLAGADTSRRRPDPVPLSAVVLAAMAEIEQYERVMSDVDDGGYITGAAVVDVVHVVAELLENATAYSPPDSTVLVVGRVAPDGRSATVRIADRGLGMSEKKLAEANERLRRAGESAPVAAATAQMGLWVVARLAARHGISVRLRALTAGVQAEISIPGALLSPAPTRPYVELARSVLRSSMTHLLGRELSLRENGADAAPAVAAGTGGVNGTAGAGGVNGTAGAGGVNGTAGTAGRSLPAQAGDAVGPAGPSGHPTLPEPRRPDPPADLPLSRRETPAYGTPPLPRSPVDPAVAAAMTDPPDGDAATDPVAHDANLDGWTRPIRLPAQPDAPRSRRDRHTNAAPATAAAPARPHQRPTEPVTTGAHLRGMVPAPADGGTSSAGLPVRVPMAQLPHNPLAGPPPAAPGQTPDESDPAEVSAALNRFYRARHRASSDDTLG